MGNGCADDVFDGNALVPFAHGMGLISDELFEVCGSNMFCIVQMLYSFIFRYKALEELLNFLVGRAGVSYVVRVNTMVSLMFFLSFLECWSLNKNSFDHEVLSEMVEIITLHPKKIHVKFDI